MKYSKGNLTDLYRIRNIEIYSSTPFISISCFNFSIQISVQWFDYLHIIISHSVNVKRSLSLCRYDCTQVTGSQLYGVDETTQRHLRLLSNGKLKTEYSNNEYYPPRISFAKKISLAFLQMEPEGKTHWVRITQFI
jgi:hypothetical protein